MSLTLTPRHSRKCPGNPKQQACCLAATDLSRPALPSAHPLLLKTGLGDGPGDLGYFHDPAFDEPQAHRKLRTPPVEQPTRRRTTPPEEVPSFLAHLWRVPLLSAAREHFLFRKYNYLKYRVAVGCEELHRCRSSEATQQQLHRDASEAHATRNAIIEANLRLVVSLAKKHASGRNEEFEEFVSLGNTTLLQAVERFDFRRGFRFSTYAYQAVQRAIYSHFDREHRRSKHVSGYLTETADEDYASDQPLPAEICIDREQQQLVGDLMETLEPREQRIVAARFGMTRASGPLSFQKIGDQLGLSKQRIRQLYRIAIDKMHHAALERRQAHRG